MRFHMRDQIACAVVVFDDFLTLWKFTPEVVAITFIEIRVGNILSHTTHDDATLKFRFFC